MDVFYENFSMLSKKTAKYGILWNNKNIGKHMYFYIAFILQMDGLLGVQIWGKWFLLDSWLCGLRASESVTIFIAL